MTRKLTTLTADAVDTLDRRISFETLTAASTDLERRTISGMIAPFNVPGRTSRGLVAVASGSLRWDADLGRIKLTAGHDREAPLGRMTAIEPRGDGLWATFKIGATPAGDTALLEASEGLRDGLSVDLVDVEIDGDRITAGQIAAVGLCAVPAYADARVDRVAAMATDDPDTGDAGNDPSTRRPASPAYAPPAAVEPSRRSPARAADRSGESELTAIASAIAATARGDMTPAALTAALADFTTNPASGGAALPPQWVGQLWTEADASRPHVEAITGPRPLTSLKVQGFQWIETLKVDKWAGDKVQIPTNAPTMGPAESTAQRWAGGCDVGREFIDLGDGSVVRDLLVQATLDYKMKTDLDCLDKLLVGATDLAEAADTLAALAALYGAFRTIRVRPSTVWMATNLFDELANEAGPANKYGGGSIDGSTGNINGRAFEEDPDLPDWTILGVAKSGATFYEKGPIQVSALEITRGGIDEAVHGYTSTLINRAAAVVAVTVDDGVVAATSSSKQSN